MRLGRTFAFRVVKAINNIRCSRQSRSRDGRLGTRNEHNVVDFPSSSSVFSAGVLESDIAVRAFEAFEADFSGFDPVPTASGEFASQQHPSGSGRIFAVVVVGEEHLNLGTIVVTRGDEGQHGIGVGVQIEGGRDEPIFIFSLVVGVHIGVVVAVVLGDDPTRGVAQNADLGPTIPIVLPVLVEDNGETCLNDIFGVDNGAVVIAFQRGVSPNGHVFVDEDGIFIFSPRTFFGFKAVVDGCTFSGASDGNFL